MEKLKAVLFKSKERFAAFQNKLESYGIETIILDFENEDWIEYDYSKVDFLIYYPSFSYTSNSPLALQEVYDNLIFISSEFPDLHCYPDPGLLKYYNDKYRQYLFLRKHNFVIPDTIPLLSKDCVGLADKRLNYPMIIKNRYGAGGGAVYRINNKKELDELYKLSTLNLWHVGGAKFFGKLFSKRIFYYNLIKAKKAIYPFLSPPLMAQKFIPIEKDLKTVVGDREVVEGHWRLQAHKDMWKMNIDDGGIGQWSHIPREPLDISLNLAEALNATWLNIDFLINSNEYYISEFSPVWHHYGYKEKPTFVYKEDYNLKIPLEISLDLERIIIESLMKRCAE